MIRLGDGLIGWWRDAGNQLHDCVALVLHADGSRVLLACKTGALQWVPIESFEVDGDCIATSADLEK